MSKLALPEDNKQREQIEEQYKIEKVLAEKLRNSTKSERAGLYTSLYDELFSKIPFHPLLTYKSTPDDRLARVKRNMKFFQHLLHKDIVFLEVGPGDCALAIEVAKSVKKVYAVDVSREITKMDNIPENFEVSITDGASIDVPEASVDIAFSNQLMEHLHPDDALEQLKNIYKTLKKGGVYICITPNKLTGPHDVSGYFDNIATGFHLKEYTHRELYDLFKKVGFRNTYSYINVGASSLKIPIQMKMFLEDLTALLPGKIRNRWVHSFLMSRLLNIKIVGKK